MLLFLMILQLTEWFSAGLACTYMSASREGFRSDKGQSKMASLPCLDLSLGSWDCWTSFLNLGFFTTGQSQGSKKMRVEAIKPLETEA